MKDLSKIIELYCPVCGCQKFTSLDVEFEELINADNSSKLQCENCKKIFSKSEIYDGNQEIINANIEEIGKEAILKLKKQLESSYYKR